MRRVTAFGAMGRAERLITAPGPHHGETITVRTPTTVYGVLEFVSGTIFNLGLSWDVAGLRRINEVELHGTEATLFDTSPSEFGGELRAVGIDGKPHRPRPLGASARARSTSPTASARTRPTIAASGSPT